MKFKQIQSCDWEKNNLPCNLQLNVFHNLSETVSRIHLLQLHFQRSLQKINFINCGPLAL